MSISGDLGSLGAPAGVQSLLAEKRGLELKEASVKATDDSSKTQTVSGSNGQSTEVTTGGKNNNAELEKGDIKNRIAELDGRIATMRAQEAKTVEQNKDKQTLAKNDGANPNQNNGQQANNKDSSISGTDASKGQNGGGYTQASNSDSNNGQTGSTQGQQSQPKVRTEATT